MIRVDIQSDAGRQLARIYSARLTPTFVLFGPAGEEVWRSVGNLDSEQVQELIAK